MTQNSVFLALLIAILPGSVFAFPPFLQPEGPTSELKAPIQYLKCVDLSGTWSAIDGPCPKTPMTIQQSSCRYFSLTNSEGNTVEYMVGGMVNVIKSDEVKITTQTDTASWNSDHTVLMVIDNYMYQTPGISGDPVGKVNSTFYFKIENGKLVFKVVREDGSHYTCAYQRQ